MILSTIGQPGPVANTESSIVEEARWANVRESFSFKAGIKFRAVVGVFVYNVVVVDIVRAD